MNKDTLQIAPTNELLSIINDAQAILTEYLVPDGIAPGEAINLLLELLDGPRYREAIAALESRPAMAEWRTVVGRICEGYTLDADVRKQLETLLWSTQSPVQPATDAAVKMIGLLRKIVDSDNYQSRCANADMLAHDIRTAFPDPQPKPEASKDDYERIALTRLLLELRDKCKELAQDYDETHKVANQISAIELDVVVNQYLQARSLLSSASASQVRGDTIPEIVIEALKHYENAYVIDTHPDARDGDTIDDGELAKEALASIRALSTVQEGE